MRKQKDPELLKDDVVVVGIDETASVPHVVKFITEHKWPHHTHFELVHVIAPIMVDPLSYYPIMMESIESDIRSYADKLLEQIEKEIKSKVADCTVHSDIEVGSPAEVIIQTAKDLAAGLIVVGSHGRTGISRFLLGSVSGAVVSHAHCNVMIVRIPDVKVEVKSESDAQKIRATAAQS